MQRLLERVPKELQNILQPQPLLRAKWRKLDPIYGGNRSYLNVPSLLTLLLFKKLVWRALFWHYFGTFSRFLIMLLFKYVFIKKTEKNRKGCFSF